MRWRNSIKRSRRRGTSPNSARTSASACGSTARPFGRVRKPRRRPRPETSTATVSLIEASLPITLFEKVTMFFDVRGKVERVLAHQPLGEFRVATLERLDDPHVIDNRARCAIVL